MPLKSNETMQPKKKKEREKSSFNCQTHLAQSQPPSYKQQSTKTMRKPPNSNPSIDKYPPYQPQFDWYLPGITEPLTYS